MDLLNGLGVRFSFIAGKNLALCVLRGLPREPHLC